MSDELKRLANACRGIISLSDPSDFVSNGEWRRAVADLEAALVPFRAAPASRAEETRPQTPRDPTGESPPLETDPRARQCGKHGVLLYPGELCRACLASEPNGSAEGSR